MYNIKDQLQTKWKKVKGSIPIPKLNKSTKSKPLSFKTGAFLYAGFIITGLLIGSVIATYIFFGLIILSGLIALVECNSVLKYIVRKTNKLCDLLIFALSLYATVSLGITLTASLTFAGLGYTLVYAPWLRSRSK